MMKIEETAEVDEKERCKIAPIGAMKSNLRVLENPCVPG